MKALPTMKNNMKKFIIALLFATVGLTAHAQVGAPRDDDNGNVFVKVDKQAAFPGGLDGWRTHLQKNLKAQLAAEYVPLKKGEKSAQRTVYVQFQVDKEGKISEVRALNAGHPDIHPALFNEAIRVIKEGPDWIPAELNKEKVNFRTVQPIIFQVTK